MTINVEKYDPSEPEILKKQHSFLNSIDSSIIQQSGYWSKIVRDISPDKPFIFNAMLDGEIVGSCVLYLYEANSGNIIFSDPHAGSLGSIAVKPSYDSQKIVDALEEEILKTANQHNCLTITVSSNPFVEQSPVEKYFSYDFALYDRVHYIAMEDFFDENGRVQLDDYNRRSNLSRNIQEGQESSLTIKQSYSKQDLKQWYRVHSDHLEALGAEPIPFEFFENAHELSLNHPFVEYLYVMDHDEVVGGGLYVRNENIVDILMMSTTYEAMDKGANFLLTDWALKHYFEMDVDIFNWQASNPPDGGIVRFKEQWGSKEAPFGYFTKLLVDIDEILNLGIDTIRKDYQWHYVVPYGIFENTDKTTFHKTESEIFHAS